MLYLYIDVVTFNSPPTIVTLCTCVGVYMMIIIIIIIVVEFIVVTEVLLRSSVSLAAHGRQANIVASQVRYIRQEYSLWFLPILINYIC